MARRKVETAEFMVVKRDYPKTEFLGWGTRQTRKTTTVATSPRLLAYRSCIAGRMAGKDFRNLKEVQEAFRATAKECAKEASSKPTILKKKSKKSKA